MKTLRAAVGSLLLLSLSSPAAVTADDAPAAGERPGAQAVDCDMLARMPNAPMSVEACRQMVGVMDPSSSSTSTGARPGDDKMSCEDIAAEMRTVKGVGLTEEQRKENAAAASEYQSTLARQQAEAGALGVEATAATQAAAAADAATTLSTGGLVQGRAAQATQAVYQARADAMGRQMAEERKPQEERLASATSASVEAMGKELRENPRYARLVQLAVARDCKGP